MKELVIGTSNRAKIAMVQSALKPSGIQVKSALELGAEVVIREDGRNQQENASKKSIAYAVALGRPVLSIDNALYLDGLADEQQPGMHTRRVGANSARASDEELLQYYTRLISRLGGQVSGRWEFALCIADPTGRIFEKTIISPRWFVDQPSERIIPGYPLESIQIEPSSGKYVSEMTPEEQDVFWQEKIGRELQEFVKQALGELSG